MPRTYGRPTSAVRRQARDRFAELLKSNSREAAWQAFFAEHPYVLSESLPLKLIPSDIEVRGRPGQSEADFILFRRRPAEPTTLGIIELKRPDTDVLRVPRKRVLSLSANATTAVALARAYACDLQRTAVAHEQSPLAIGNEMHMFLIMGLSSEIALKINTDLEAQFAGLFWPGVRWVPYDTLFDMYADGVQPRVHLLRPPLPAAAAMAALIVDYAHRGRVTRRANSRLRPLRGIRVDGRWDRIAAPGACPYCDRIDGAVSLSAWVSTPTGSTLQRFFAGVEAGRAYRMLACSGAGLDEPLAFCEVYDVDDAARWFEALHHSTCGRCRSTDIETTSWGSPPAYECTAWICRRCGLSDEKHTWGSTSSGA